uniref:TMhelix containing protein n=1 Tax=Klebsiella phage FKP3 TaxID=3231233 RepID=A0AAU8HZA3_9CAUD
MDQQLEAKASELLVKMIDVTVQSVSDVVEFGKQQIPEVIHQLLMWNALKASIWVVVAAVFSIFLCTVVNRAKPVLNEADYGFGTVVQILGWVIAMVLGGTVFMYNLLQAVYIMIAPKVWLIEYAAELVKK